MVLRVGRRLLRLGRRRPLRPLRGSGAPIAIHFSKSWITASGSLPVGGISYDSYRSAESSRLSSGLLRHDGRPRVAAGPQSLGRIQPQAALQHLGIGRMALVAVLDQHRAGCASRRTRRLRRQVRRAAATAVGIDRLSGSCRSQRHADGEQRASKAGLVADRARSHGSMGSNLRRLHDVILTADASERRRMRQAAPSLLGINRAIRVRLGAGNSRSEAAMRTMHLSLLRYARSAVRATIRTGSRLCHAGARRLRDASVSAARANRQQGNSSNVFGRRRAERQQNAMLFGAPNAATTDTGNGAASANADFDSLIDLIQSTVATETWAENGGGEAEIRPFPAACSSMRPARCG